MHHERDAASAMCVAWVNVDEVAPRVHEDFGQIDGSGLLRGRPDFKQASKLLRVAARPQGTQHLKPCRVNPCSNMKLTGS